VAHAAFDRDRGPEWLPGSETDLERFVRTRSQTLYHPVGTCRMGADRDAVVSARLRVHGIEDLWVADASVMPAITTGHPHAAVIAIGERAALLASEG
jgi:choline dehydrogenase